MPPGAEPARDIEPMITGAHVVVFSEDADADRAFLRDVLGFGAVDAGGGWLIFALPPAELAGHPAGQGAPPEPYLMCDGLERTTGDPKAKGGGLAHPGGGE